MNGLIDQSLTTDSGSGASRAAASGSEGVVFEQLTALSDPIRTRLLLALERQELTVRELQQILQLPQSTVSRHLGVLAGAGWVTARSSGPSNWYRMAGRDLPDTARQLWQVVRSQAESVPAARRDAERTGSVLAARQSRSREFFASSAGQWDRLRAELFGRAAVVAPLLGVANPDWVVADLGCGTGELAAQLAPHVARMIAVDDSAPMLEAARQRLAGAGNVDLRAASLEALPIDGESVDLVFAVLVLHHLSDPSQAVNEAARILRPGGRLVIVDMVPHEHAEYRELMGHQWLGFDAAAVGRWCERAGFGPPSYRVLSPDPEARGPNLFVAGAVRADRGPSSTTNRP